MPDSSLPVAVLYSAQGSLWASAPRLALLEKASIGERTAYSASASDILDVDDEQWLTLCNLNRAIRPENARLKRLICVSWDTDTAILKMSSDQCN